MPKAKTSCQPFSLGKSGFFALTYPPRNKRIALRARAGSMGVMASRPRAGDPAPRFEGVTTDGRRVSLDDYRGRTLVLYFYPKDDTPGCTRQACSLRDFNA